MGDEVEKEIRVLQGIRDEKFVWNEELYVKTGDTLIRPVKDGGSRRGELAVAPGIVVEVERL